MLVARYYGKISLTLIQDKILNTYFRKNLTNKFKSQKRKAVITRS